MAAVGSSSKLFGDIPGLSLRIETTTSPIYTEYNNTTAAELELSRKKIQNTEQALCNYILIGAAGAILSGGVAGFLRRSRLKWRTITFYAAVFGSASGSALSYRYSYLQYLEVVESERLNVWQMEAHRECEARVIVTVIEMLDAIMLERGTASGNYLCHATSVFIRQPETDADGYFYAKGQGALRDLSCKLLETDVVKLRFRFVEEILAHNRLTINPKHRHILGMVKRKLKSDYKALREQIRQDITNELAEMPIGPQRFAQLRTWEQALNASTVDCDCYPFATDGQQQRQTY